MNCQKSSLFLGPKHPATCISFLWRSFSLSADDLCGQSIYQVLAKGKENSWRLNIFYWYACVDIMYYSAPHLMCVCLCVLLTAPLTLPASVSRSFPTVDSSLHKHSRDTPCSFLMSLTRQLCIMASVTIFSLKSSPINLTVPSECSQALCLACSSCSFNCWHSASLGSRLPSSVK